MKDMQDLTKRMEAVEKALEMAGLATKEVLTLKEAAQFAGLSSSYFYKLTSGHKIPHYKPAGKVCYFNRLELQEWLLQNRIKTVDELKTEAANIIVAGKHSKKGGVK
jgi:excisionase family DNA binding protein